MTKTTATRTPQVCMFNNTIVLQVLIVRFQYFAHFPAALFFFFFLREMNRFVVK